MNKLICITVDLEQDYGGRADSYLGATTGTPLLLDILRKYGIKATFFTSSEVAQTYPEIIKKIINDGHEIASHSHIHTNLTLLTPQQTKEQITTSKKILEQFGIQIQGFRAPYLKTSPEILKQLAQAGYKYDSSLIGKKVKPIQENLIEIPISDFKYIGQPLSLSRLKINFTIIKNLIRKNNNPTILYLHPHELVQIPEQNFTQKLPATMKQNPEHTIETLEKLFTTIFDSEQYTGRQYVPLKKIYEQFTEKNNHNGR